MDLDPRLQDLTYHHFASNQAFDPNYNTTVYNHGLVPQHNLPAHSPPRFVQQNPTDEYFNVSEHQQQQLQPQSLPSTHVHPQTRRRVQHGVQSAVNHAPADARDEYLAQPSQQPSQQRSLSQHTLRPTSSTSTHGQQALIPVQAIPPSMAPRHNTQSSNATASDQNSPPSTTLTKDLSNFTSPSSFPLIPDPPNLSEWRQKFFNISSPLYLTSEEYHTYFPHVDNIYSHRSTQRYKRKPFVSHYWDCRLKGRPTGTPMGKPKKTSSSATKDNENDSQIQQDEDGDEATASTQEPKKRKRKTRERDLCDVKIKVTEHFGTDEIEAMMARTGISGGTSADDTSHQNPRSTSTEANTDIPDITTPTPRRGQHQPLTFVHEHHTATTPTQHRPIPVQSSSTSTSTTTIPFGVLEPPRTFPPGHPGASGKIWYTIQRVNGVAAVASASLLSSRTHQNDDDPDDLLPSATRTNDDDDGSLDHKHTLEESDRIKKNSVQRWIIAREKEGKRRLKHPSSTTLSDPTTTTSQPHTTDNNNGTTTSHPRQSSSTNSTTKKDRTYLASGPALHTVRQHSRPAPSNLTLYANSFCPFAQRVWIALEVKRLPYRYVELTPGLHMSQDGTGTCNLPEVLAVNPEGILPCVVHGSKWAVWESGVVLEYLEDLTLSTSLSLDGGDGSGGGTEERPAAVGEGRRRGVSTTTVNLLPPLSEPQLRAHCRLWTDHINRKILPLFYALLLAPVMDLDHPGTGEVGVEVTTATQQRQQSTLTDALQGAITSLVNASHASGPFFLGPSISFVDVAFAPWIIRLSRVLSYYRDFPRPEVNTRWAIWVNAIEHHECVRRTVSDERSYHNVYGGAALGGEIRPGSDVSLGARMMKQVVEIDFAQKVVRQEGFGLGGDLMGHVQTHLNLGVMR